jgi:hypothetical protein
MIKTKCHPFQRRRLELSKATDGRISQDSSGSKPHCGIDFWSIEFKHLGLSSKSKMFLLLPRLRHLISHRIIQTLRLQITERIARRFEVVGELQVSSNSRS